MRVRKLTSSGDYTFGRGYANFYSNEPLAVGQKVQNRLGLYEGEWFLDKNDGTPWYQDVFGIRSNPTYDLAIQARILTTVGVQSIQSYSSTLSPNIVSAGVPARRLAVTVRIQTQYSKRPVTVEANL